jgi:hypothetical protein
MTVKVLMSRKWKSPEIAYTVDGIGISGAMSLEDFVTSVAIEVGNPAMILTRAALLERLQTASNAICTELRENTRLVV